MTEIRIFMLIFVVIVFVIGGIMIINELFSKFNYTKDDEDIDMKSDIEIIKEEIVKTRQVIKNRLNIIILILLLPLIFTLLLYVLGISFLTLLH